MVDSALTASDDAVLRNEAFWVARLAQQTTIELPYGRQGNGTADSGWIEIAQALTAGEIEAFRSGVCADRSAADLLVASVLTWLARISDSYTFDVGYSYPRLRQQATQSGEPLASHVPLHVELDALTSLETSLAALAGELASTRQHGSFAQDLIARHPELASRRNGDGGANWSIVIEQVESCEVGGPTPGADLTILCTMDGTQMRWIGNGAIFMGEDLAEMQHRFVTYLRNAATGSRQPVARIGVLTEAEYRQLVVEWNHTHVDYPQDRAIHQVFERQAEQTPDHPAVICEQQQLTYAELNRRANQLAHWLRSQDVGPDVHVGLAVERSLEMLVGLYAILKAGGAYVPLEPTYPPERIADILEDAHISVVLTQAHLRNVLPAAKVRVLCIDANWDSDIAGRSTENPDSLITLENLAYTIYTSGSTGKPKGVMNTHRGILNRLLWMQETYQLTACDRVLQKTPFSFDVSVWEFFWPCMFGASLVVARPEGHKDNDYLVRTIIDRQITVMHFVPSMLQLFLQTPNVSECRSLRDVICSGEALPADLRDHFFARLDARLHNLYGPTEAAVDVTFWQCRREDPSDTIPIGRPVANTQMYILDRYMQPAPVGIPGQLHIGGVQVACGYLNRPEVTAEKFVPDPFRSDSQARLYKTGDLARYLPDGNIEYLGRIDHQVKLQGFRIELGEIESVLNRHPVIRAAVVTVYGDTAAEKRLVAYLVSEIGSPLNDRLLRDYLKKRLPDHMVPATFMWLDALPLSSNGKIDRRRLPAPVQERSSTETYQAPGNEMEKTIAEIWRDVLKVDKVGIEDNFFDLGGNSFFSILVVARMREALGIDIPVTRIFQYPTVTSLARCLRDGKTNRAVPRTIQARAQRRKVALSRKRRPVG